MNLAPLREEIELYSNLASSLNRYNGLSCDGSQDTTKVFLELAVENYNHRLLSKVRRVVQNEIMPLLSEKLPAEYQFDGDSINITPEFGICLKVEHKSEGVGHSEPVAGSKLEDIKKELGGLLFIIGKTSGLTDISLS